jgi:hypothetical protein
MRCIDCVRSPINVWRSRARERHWCTWPTTRHKATYPQESSAQRLSAPQQPVLILARVAETISEEYAL